ncbi:SMP-30/gluconolactonase/LRE family protein [Mycetocola tolaasinivorans]|uniref:SMP-30/gluconolactonase/LRE family protein n=1 Tax=Mycetocola tolaasinivorans TaxID=76635 RepID=A0A3L7A6S7_9MICO|nr:SMP-30/gluconolactonase/LRE family protein [Mycetocola tolaasinivorans]RLP75588.1 SMP-30/gluconolactonase/LRE family protein [Mycetocola tolaasinivorans]
MTQIQQAEQVTDPVAYHGEGAVWSESWGGLRWVDMLAGDILSLDARTGRVERLATGSPVAAMIRPRVGGGFVAVTEREFSLWTEAGREWVSEPVWPGPTQRFNEGGCTPEGDLFCGTMAYERVVGTAEVFRFGADRSVSPLFDGVTISNGLGFSADGTRMFYVDSPTRRIDVFDYADGVLTNRRPFVTLPEGVGGPDGLTVDSEDGVWIALYGGSAVRRYDREGTLTNIVELPVSKITSCTLGGADLRTLYITTSREFLEPHDEPLAGSVFAASVEIAGLPVLPYAG